MQSTIHIYYRIEKIGCSWKGVCVLIPPREIYICADWLCSIFASWVLCEYCYLLYVVIDYSSPYLCSITVYLCPLLLPTYYCPSKKYPLILLPTSCKTGLYLWDDEHLCLLFLFVNPWTLPPDCVASLKPHLPGKSVFFCPWMLIARSKTALETVWCPGHSCAILLLEHRRTLSLQGIRLWGATLCFWF